MSSTFRTSNKALEQKIRQTEIIDTNLVNKVWLCSPTYPRPTEVLRICRGGSYGKNGEKNGLQLIGGGVFLILFTTYLLYA